MRTNWIFGCRMSHDSDSRTSQFGTLQIGPILNTARSARERVRTPGDIQEVIYEQRERVFHRDIQTRENNV
jgi:hypothetical protein